MPMNPMSPRQPPPAPPVFKALAELNEFLAHSQKDREAIFDAWGSASEQRTTALDEIATALEASESDRENAKRALAEAGVEASEAIREAKVASDEIVRTAKATSLDMAKDNEASLAQAKAVNENLNARVTRREADATAREAACDEREANAFKDREDAVLLRENEVSNAEKIAIRQSIEAQKLKATYDKLIDSIEALKRGAPS